MRGVVGLLPAVFASASAVLPLSSVPLAFTVSPSLTLSAGIVITPVSGSIVAPESSFSGSFHLPSEPFSAVTVLSLPSSSLNLTSTLVLSLPGLTVTEPSSFAVISGLSAVASLLPLFPDPLLPP